MTDKRSLPFARSYWVQSGKLLAGCYPGSADYEEGVKKLSGLLDCGIRHVINLMEEGEKDKSGQPFVPYENVFIALGEAKGIEASITRMPIRDVSVPTPQAMRAILDEINKFISINRPVYVHCWGGRGRTGTVVGCYLVRHGLTGKEALKKIKELRRNESTGYLPSPETREQIKMVLSWGKLDKKS